MKTYYTIYWNNYKINFSNIRIDVKFMDIKLYEYNLCYINPEEQKIKPTMGPFALFHDDLYSVIKYILYIETGQYKYNIYELEINDDLTKIISSKIVDVGRYRMLT